jgi:exodeoxyribonuclease VII large subunit
MALILEITGQGPEKTLARGFAIVRNADGATETGADAVARGTSIQIEFRNGLLAATTVS